MSEEQKNKALESVIDVAAGIIEIPVHVVSEPIVDSIVEGAVEVGKVAVEGAVEVGIAAVEIIAEIIAS
jgi:hypothetical protein